SSRRRHTRWPRDWSSDVCSSDLFGTPADKEQTEMLFAFPSRPFCSLCFKFPGNRFPPKPIVFLLRSCKTPTLCMQLFTFLAIARSEERRVGKDCRCWR